MRCLFSPVVVAVLALPLLFASRSATAAPPVISPPAAPSAPKVLALWTSTDKGFFFTFSDGAAGAPTPDDTYASQKQTQFSGVSVVLFDNGDLKLGTIQNNTLTPLAVLTAFGSNDLTFLVAHSKSSDGKTFFDGEVYAATDLKTATFIGTLTEISADGKTSKTTHVDLDLAAPSSTTPNTPSTSPSTTPSSGTGQ